MPQYIKNILKPLNLYHPEDRLHCRDTYHLFVVQVKKER